MYTDEIIQVLKTDPCTKPYFLGCFASNRIPQQSKTRKPCGFICNTQRDDEPGDHWLAVWTPKNSKTELFDSFGRSPIEISSQFNSDLKTAGISDFYYNSVPFQHILTETCGKFSIFFVISRIHGISFEKTLESFHKTNSNANELFIKNFFQKYFKYIKM